MSQDPNMGHIGKINVGGIKLGSNEPYAEEEQRRLLSDKRANTDEISPLAGIYTRCP